jgi:peptidoglycan/LPS O-acetylase OafA/YrhL
MFWTVNLPYLLPHLAIVEQCIAMPTFSELYPICVLLFTFLTTGWLIHHTYPSPADDKPRDIQIDGLRGLLAFGVMTYHYFGIRHLIINGELRFDRTSSITALLAGWTVPIFFAITAYLFSQRLLRLENHQGRSISKFLLGRVFRLIPTTLLACVLFLLTNFVVYTDMHDPKLLLHNWKVLLNASLSSIRHPASGPDSEQIATWAWSIACAPQWTLHFEWIFYLSLAALSVLTLKKQSMLLPALILIVLMIGVQGTRDFFQNWDFMTWAFVPGLILGLTNKYWKNSRYLSHPVTAMIAVATVIASAFYSKLKVKIPANTLFLAVILSNNTATRCLESKLLRSLGETTYSIYLLHGIVQYITLKWIVTIEIARNMPEYLWWLTCAVQVVVIVIVARLSFEFVEKPGIEVGKRFYVWLMNLIERRAKWLLNWI